MARERVLTVQRTVYLSPEMWDYLTQLAAKRGRDCNENTLIREALRGFIEGQSEIIGSRRHFQKSLQESLDQVEQRLTHSSTTTQFYLHIVIQLLAFSMAHVITAITHKEITAQQLLHHAVIEARREEAVFSAQVQSVRDMTAPEQ
ncbi:MAG: hypothetical protein ABI947_23020 [Chloroflexota bacterium]